MHAGDDRRNAAIFELTIASNAINWAVLRIAHQHAGRYIASKKMACWNLWGGICPVSPSDPAHALDRVPKPENRQIKKHTDTT